MNYYVIFSRTNTGSVRIIKAKSRNAAMRHVYKDQWIEPAIATIDDVAQAAADGVKPESAEEE